jgi:hypothetical protein
MASDQRYCVECGERRGEQRLPAITQVSDRAGSPSSRSSAGRSRLSPSATLIAGIATLLLALGVGVLIGRSSNGSQSHAATAAPYVVTVNGGAASTGTGAATGTTSSTATPATSATGKSTSSKAAKSTKKAAPKVVKVGSKGTGKGYNKEHKFTGEFFGEEEKE